MIERGLYYATDEFSQMIRSVGGTWNDTKRRPIVCLIKSDENPNLYWAIPMGKLNHRKKCHAAKASECLYLNLPRRDIRSCYYPTLVVLLPAPYSLSATPSPLLINTLMGSIPVSDHRHYIIKNRLLISELERKLFRILC